MQHNNSCYKTCLITLHDASVEYQNITTSSVKHTTKRTLGLSVQLVTNSITSEHNIQDLQTTTSGNYKIIQYNTKRRWNELLTASLTSSLQFNVMANVDWNRQQKFKIKMMIMDLTSQIKLQLKKKWNLTIIWCTSPMQPRLRSIVSKLNAVTLHWKMAF